MEYRRGAGDLLFPLPCQRPEGAQAGRSRSSHDRSFAHTVTEGAEEGGGKRYVVRRALQFQVESTAVV
jgi:hypothetical protein